MAETPVHKCSQCGQNNPLTPEFYGVNAASPTGFRNICKICFSENRYGDKTKAVQALRLHDKLVAKAKTALDNKLDTLSPGQIQKFETIVRLAPEHREELQKKILDARKAEEAAKFAQTANPALARVQAQFGSAVFTPPAERGAVLEQLQAALATLTGPADGPARDFVQSNIALLTEMLANAAARTVEKVQYEQQTIDGRACQDAADAIHDKFAGLFGGGVSAVERDKLKALFQIVREEAQQQHKTIKPDEVTATGANRKVVSSRILEELTAIAGRLGKAGTEVGAHQSLENAQSLDWQQALSARDMRQYVRELTAKLEAARATMTPEQYQKKYMELPVAPKEEIIVWRVRLLDGREEWMWPSGTIVRRGTDIGSSEIVKDALHGWVIAPSPAGAELDDENKPVGKLECVQEDDGSFVYKVVDPEERWEQGNDGLWTKVAGSDSPWSRPQSITFKVGPAQPDAAHSEFRIGNWFTPAECDAVEKAPMLDMPPVVLPPLERTKADSIALEPPMTKEELAKWSEEPNRWRRHEQREKQQKEAEQAMLRGVFVWDKNQATTN